jgi:hypothetical protein
MDCRIKSGNDNSAVGFLHVGRKVFKNYCIDVMPALVPGIHVFVPS